MALPLELHLTHTRSATVFSDDRRYRYLLTRRWDEGPLVGLIGLNPSTVCEHPGTRSERWFRSFAKSRGFAGYTAANLYASVRTGRLHPGGLVDPVGPDDDVFIDRLAATHDMVVFAWGDSADSARAHAVASRVWCQCSRHGGTVAVLGWTANEQPLDPLHPHGHPALRTLTSGAHPALSEIDRRWLHLLDGIADLDAPPE